MSYRQLVSPNLDPVLHQGGHTLTDWVGWCLLYVQTACGAGWAGSNAWEAWCDHVSYKHEDRDLPAGVFVVLWFSGYHNMGHAVLYKDGTIWSTPTSKGFTATQWHSIEDIERHYGVTYVGWSEDIGGKRLVEPLATAPLYIITAISPKPIHVLPGRQKWNLAQPDMAAVTANPITNSGDGFDFTAVAMLTRSDAGFEGAKYYLDDANTPHGWNALDCTDPVPIPIPPTGAAPFPTPDEDYPVVVDVPGYVSSNAAANHLGKSIAVKAGDYKVFAKKFQDNDPAKKLLAVNVTHTPGKSYAWINPDDNHEPIPEPAPAPKDSGWLGPREDGTPAPTPPLEPVVRESQVPKKPSEVPIGTQADNTWKSGYKALNLQNRSEEYELVQPWTMKEYSGKKNPVPLAQGTKLNITGTFTKNGVKFYRTRSARDEFFAWWYAIPAVDDNGRAVLVKLPPEPAQPTDNYLTLQDVAYYLKSDLSRLKIWDVIRGKKVNK